MAEIHYLISDASKKVDVEAHVLRYWEEELEVEIPRNDMGHRYYTDFHICLFRQVKELKEKGYQLKAIKSALSKSLEQGGQAVISSDVLEEDMLSSIKETTELSRVEKNSVESIMAEEKMATFQKVMNHMIGRAMEENSEKLCQDIGYFVHDKIVKEMDYLMRVSDEKEEERFKLLDEAIRSTQKDNKGKAEAAASKVPFFPFKKKKFGRNGNKVRV